MIRKWLVPLAALAVLGLVPSRGDRAARPAAGAAAPREDGAGLWQKAVGIYGSNRDWYPQRITILSEVLNRRGEPYSVTQLFFTLRFDAQGRIKAELARALKNGEDTTEKMREKVRIRDPQERVDPDKEESYSVSFSDSPFDPRRQDAVTYAAGPDRHSIFGHSCRRFDFSYRTAIVRKGQREELTWNGMAWLEEDSGMPVKLEFALAPLPRRIRSLWTIYLYDTSRPERWRVKSIRISGHGGFLFIKKHFRTTTTFSDYRLAPPKEVKK